MKCHSCGAEIPDNSIFCPYCGIKIKDIEVKNEQKNISEGEILKEMNCPRCGAPLNPLPGDSIVVCSYCGTTVFLNPNGAWEKIKRHLILDISIPEREKALERLKIYMDSSILNRHSFEKSTILSSELTYIPYWIIRATYISNFIYTKTETTSFRGNVYVQPIDVPGMESGELYVPVIARKDLSEFQPYDYEFNISKARQIKESDISSGVKLLNGDININDIENNKNNFVINYVISKIRKKYRTLKSISVQPNVEEIFILHAPIWKFELEIPGLLKKSMHKVTYLMDASNGIVMEKVSE
ncbi:MAG: zinc ribbon domain-containing protein [Thermoplasmata archaeon]